MQGTDGKNSKASQRLYKRAKHPLVFVDLSLEKFAEKAFTPAALRVRVAFENSG